MHMSKTESSSFSGLTICHDDRHAADSVICVGGFINDSELSWDAIEWLTLNESISK